MAAKFIARTVELTTEYAAISATSCVGSFTIVNEGAHSAYIQSDDGATDVELPAERSVTLHGVDLADVLVKGYAATSSEFLTVIGQAGGWGL